MSAWTGLQCVGSDPQGADVEVNPDIDVAAAAAPRRGAMYLAPNNDDQGFVAAICDAAQASPVPVAISIPRDDACEGQGSR